MREKQFLMVLPSNSNMRYFPENTTTSFITELLQTIHLHREWEVAKRDPIFLYFFTPHGENVLRFIDIKYGDEKDEIRLAKEIVISNGLQRYRGYLSPQLIQGTKAPNHICISNNKTRQTEKSVYGLAVKKMGIAKNLIT